MVSDNTGAHISLQENVVGPWAYPKTRLQHASEKGVGGIGDGMGSPNWASAWGSFVFSLHQMWTATPQCSSA